MYVRAGGLVRRRCLFAICDATWSRVGSDLSERARALKLPEFVPGFFARRGAWVEYLEQYSKRIALG